MTLKRILTVTFAFFCLSLVKAQQSPVNYAAKWKLVDSLIGKKGLTESALKEVDRIYTTAMQEHNEAQQLRVLVYRLQLTGQKTDEPGPASIKLLTSGMSEMRQPARSILESLLASAYWSYLQQNRRKFYNRTETVNFVKTDVTTWTIDDLTQKISALFQSSLKEEKLLRQTSLESFEPVILKGNVRNLRPTLFDLLAHRALDYFKSGEQTLNRPADVFVIDDRAALADALDFSQHTFKTTDTASLHYKALLLFQRLVSQHLGDVRPDALIDVDIERLQYCYNWGSMDNKVDSYKKALSRLTDRYPNEPAAAQAWYLQAQLYAAVDGGAASPEDTLKYDNVKAKSICESVLAQKENSEGKANCSQLLFELSRKQLRMQTEAVNVPYQPLRSLVTWSNFDHLYLRLVSLESFQRKLTELSYDETTWKWLLGLPAYRSFSLDLPATADYRLHSTEIAIGALPPGAYALISGTDASLSQKGTVSIQYFNVSSIAYMSNGQDYFVVNRESGKPLPGASVQVWNDVYSGNGRQLLKAESYRTDSHGHFLLRRKKDDRNINTRKLEITTAGDHLFLQQSNIWLPLVNDEGMGSVSDSALYEKNNAHTYFFIDRAIYRPGQTLYFKGITVTRDLATKQAKVMADRTTTIFLFNANGEKIDSIQLKTNELGSCHGMFRLPENQLNGQFRISDDLTGNNQYFSIEEYKRPTFYVDYDKQKGSYRIGDSIRVKGNVKAYAGNLIDGAKVKYRVTGRIRYPHPWLMRPVSGWHTDAEMEIGHGELKTDGKGEFQVVFMAKPYRATSPETDAQFDYTVTADVTDISGETRSLATTIVAGYKLLNLSLTLPDGDRVASDSLRRLEIRTTNLSGEPVASKVQIRVIPLEAPKRLIRERLWPAPDRWLMTEAAFLDSFPHDEYREETKKEHWARGGMAWEAVDSTGGAAFKETAAEADGTKAIAVPQGRLGPGWYVIEATTSDKYGQEVKDRQYMELFDGRTGRPATPQYDWASDLQQKAEPGSRVRVETGSSAPDVFVIRKKEKAEVTTYQDRFGPKQKDSTDPFDYLTVNNEKNSTAQDITEADRGGIGFTDVFVKDNRLYTHTSVILVPWTNKQLAIHYTTYRDKTEPGSGEKWQLRISGYRGEQVTAEVLTAMYDASLDQFAPHNWSIPELYPTYVSGLRWEGRENFTLVQSQERNNNDNYTSIRYDKRYDQLLTDGDGIGGLLQGRVSGLMLRSSQMLRIRGLTVEGEAAAPAMAKAEFSSMGMEQDKLKSLPTVDIEFDDSMAFKIGNRQSHVQAQQPVQVRKNFNETAFFFPDLQTDAQGNVSFSFTMPEALTSWKWMTLAYDRKLAFDYAERSIVTQKKLMVQPNAPRFLREGDRMELPVKIVNMSDSELTGQMSLQLTDPTTGQTADGQFVNRQPNQYFTVGAGQSAVVSFPLDIPFQYNKPVTYRVVAQARDYSDGEEATLPVVSNRMLVTETLPLNMPGDGTRHFTFAKLLNSGGSETLNHHALTVEFTANPAWYAVEALPYLMEYPHECAEQLFDRYYANALASKIVNSSPKMKQLFSTWRTADTAALLSNLQKNQELKSVLLEETPWVMEGKTEAQQKKNIALLFELTRMDRELGAALDRLKAMQSANGSFPWFKGGYEDRYITQYILTGIGHLQQLKVVSPDKIASLVKPALAYVDAQLKKDYEQEIKTKGARPQYMGSLPVQYLYMRSMFNNYGIPGEVFAAVNYYRKKAQQLWVQESKYMQGMIALALFRTGDVQTAKNIIASLRENAIRDEEKGMYWKGMEGGYYWYQAPIEIQSLLIEAFREISGDAVIDRDLKTWLLKQKQTHNWSTTKATADACYALLLGGQDWLSQERAVSIQLGDKEVKWSAGAEEVSGVGVKSEAGATGEAGTGYYKKIFDGPFVNPSMGNITVTMHTEVSGGNGAAEKDGKTEKSGASGSPAWGAVYWQYFDMLDRITPPGGNKAPLRLAKKLFIERNTDKGRVLEPVGDNGVLKPGDRIIVRIELNSDRDLEYIHMKDMRAACMEPVNVISQYKWQDGLGYYESTKDASTDFFFSQLSKGTYVFEYPLLVGQTGNFSNGVTSVECMYAPEFASHSEGIRVSVEAAP